MIISALFFVFTFIAPTQTNAASCESYKTPKEFESIKTKLDEKIKVFSNKKEIAQRADDTLSKLISAKSPLIVSWMNSRGLNAKPEDEIIREWRLYFARNFILTKYPHEEPGINQAIAKLISEVNEGFLNKKYQAKLEGLFAKAKQQSLKAIASMQIENEAKQQLTDRVEAIRLYWMKEFKDSKFSKLPMDFLDWSIAYDPVPNEINIGINSLLYPNDETYLAVFSHEIGHSFDSCRWGAFFKGPWPFAKVGECLRQTESADAKKRDDSKMGLLEKANKELASSLKANPTCNKLGYPPVGLQADQLPESFADWFSAEVMASFTGINKSNLRTDLCEPKSLNPGSSYPTNEMRLQAIYFVHPKLKDPGKTSKYKYCAP